MSDRPYSRIYYVDLERDYPEVWRDDATLSTFVRLLTVAEAMWPATPEVPRSAKNAIVRKLTDSGLLIALPPYGYRVKGMDADRNARRTAARNAAAGRWGNAPASDAEMPNRATPSNATQLPAAQDAREWDEPEGEAMTWLAKHGCYIKPGNGYHQHLVLLVEQSGVNTVIGMFDRLARAGTKNGDTKGFVFGAKDALNPRVDLKAVEAEIRSEEREEVRRHRRPDPLLESIKAGIIEHYGPEEREGPGVAS